MVRKVKTRRDKFNRIIKYEIYGIILFIISILALGKFGDLGYNLAFLNRFLFGVWDFLLGIIGVYLAIYFIVFRKFPHFFNMKHLGIILFIIALLTFSHLNLIKSLTANNLYPETLENSSILNITKNLIIKEYNIRIPQEVGGGMIGAILFVFFQFLFDTRGTQIVIIGLILVSFMLIFNLSIVNSLKSIKNKFQQFYSFIKNKFRIRNLIQIFFVKLTSVLKKEEIYDDIHNTNVDTPLIRDFQKRNQDLTFNFEISETIHNDEINNNQEINNNEDNETTNLKLSEGDILDYHLPSSSLLNQPIIKNITTENYKDITINAKKLEQTMESFGVKAKVIQIHRGPAVTRFEIQPDIGVKVSKIVNLTDDIALALAAKDIRIEAPIPGKSAIGIEIPNQEIATVYLRELIEEKIFNESQSKLTFILGRDISGEPYIANLARMPHLLIAGATGSGKSVCINSIIISILFKAKPNEVKFLMIDPKIVELSIFNGIPHQLSPVVTDPKKAAIALKKVVIEMEKRYELFAKTGVRDMERYNALISLREGDNSADILPYIVVIVDELADLMMVASNEVEDSIIRLAQMARAAGIHLIIATQRPSVDVITGLIKANIPSRISFGVSSQIDSRTILDMNGAEKLLGRGDMLYLPMDVAKPLRIQGAFVTDQEVENVINFIKKQQDFHEDKLFIESEIEYSAKSVDKDVLYEEAIKVIVETEQASASLLQRKLKIGYARAARIIDELERDGLIGPYDGGKPRVIFITKEQLLEKKLG